MTTKTILIVEDDQAIREIVEEILVLEGYRVETAIHGEEALKNLCADVLPNLIILDLMMPVKDGFAFRREQLANPRWADIPVVVMSANGHLEDHETRKALGNLVFLEKPLSIDNILSAVAENVL